MLFFKKIILLVFVLCYHTGASFGKSNYSLYIKLNTNDCLTCYSSLNAIQKVDTATKITFIIKEEDKNFIAPFLEQYSIDLSSPQFTVTNQVDKKTAKHLAINSCLFYENKTLLYKFPVKDLLNYLYKINLISSDFSSRHKVFNLDSITLSNRLNIYSSNKKFVISDELFQTLFIGDIKNLFEPDLDLSIINTYSVNPKQLINTAKLDYANYERLYPVLKSYNLDGVKFSELYITADTIYSLSNFYYAYEELSDTILRPYLFMLKITDNQITGTLFINDSDYRIGGGSNFYKNEHQKFIFKNKKSDQINKVFSNWSENKQSLEYKNQLDFEVPKFIIEKKGSYKTISKMSNSLFYYKTYPFFINFDQQQSYELGESLKVLEGKKYLQSGFYIFDAEMQGNVLIILYKVNDKCSIIFYDCDLNKIISKKKGPFQPKEGYDIYTYKIINGKNLLIFNNEKNKLNILY